jgi:hypothetical protein
MRAWLAALLLVVVPAFADDVPIDTVNVPRETFVGLLQANLAMRARLSDLADQLEQAVKDQHTCVESRST